MKKVKKLKTILSTTLIAIMVGLFFLTIFGAYLLLSNVMATYVRDMVRSEISYVGYLIDHTSESGDGLWLDGYIIGEDPQSFVYVAADGLIINGTNMEILEKDGLLTLDDMGIDIQDMKALEQSGKPIWVTREDGGEQYAIYAGEHESGWDIVVGVTKAYLYRGIREIVTMIVWAFILLFAVLYFVLTSFLNKRIVKSIQKTNTSLKKITDGDLGETVHVTASTEFAALSTGINQTVDSLKDAIQRAEAVAWMERELSIASEIQLACMPKHMNHSLEEDNRFSLYADIRAAKEVGGDFYDYFVLGENKLGFVIADVSGKGIPAAMFMMTAKTHIKLFMEQNKSLGEAFTAINQKLCENNDVEMFVTVCAGVIDLQTGRVSYINAGHNPSALLHHGQETWLKERSGPLIGMIETAKYKELSVQLHKGDLLFLYTDGVTEAVNEEMELFGTQRLADSLKQTQGQPVRDIVKMVYEQIVAFEQQAQRADDITMLLLKWEGENE